MNLKQYDNRNFERGASRVKEVVWLLCGGLLFTTWLPGSSWRTGLLRLFGAQIETGVVIKARVRVTFPWRLKVGKYSWVGEGVWIDNLDEVVIGSNCCISQGVYLCTGSHDWSVETFDLITKPIHIKDCVWLCAKSVVGPGVTVHEGAILTLGGVANRDLDAWRIYSGNPAVGIKDRKKVPLKSALGLTKLSY